MASFAQYFAPVQSADNNDTSGGDGGDGGPAVALGFANTEAGDGGDANNNDGGDGGDAAQLGLLNLNLFSDLEGGDGGDGVGVAGDGGNAETNQATVANSEGGAGGAGGAIEQNQTNLLVNDFDDSFNEDNDGFDNKEGEISDSIVAGDDVTDSGNQETNVEIKDSFQDNSEDNDTTIEDSIVAGDDVEIEDSFNNEDNDFLDLDISELIVLG